MNQIKSKNILHLFWILILIGAVGSIASCGNGVGSGSSSSTTSMPTKVSTDL